MNYLMMLSIGSFFYILILTIIFFVRKKIENSETKIYTLLLITLLIEIILEILMRFIAPYMENLLWLNIFVSKLFVFMSLFWFSIMTIYNANISLKNDKGNNNYKVYKRMIKILLLVSLCIVLILPIEFHYETGKNYYSYTYGSSVSFVFFMFFLLMMVNLFILVGNKKTKISKKYIPVIMSTVLFIVCGIIQNLNPSLILNIYIQSLVTFLMYHTIENPDMKLLEEVHKSKEISDAANEEKTLFLYNMTQEIRNTTNEIDNNANMILESVSLDEDKDCAREIKAITSKFNSMTNEIFDVSKLDSSNIKVYNSKYNIKNILKELVTIYNKECKNKNIEFRVNIDHDVPEVLYGDSINFKEVLSIVMDNSVKYTKEGFIEFDVNTIIKNDVCRLIITIEDSGRGIKSEDISKLKLENKSLSMANKLITLMNGTMMISSNYGFGTKVKIILDQKIEVSINEDVAKYNEIYDNIKILMVDDSDSGIKIIDKLIKGSNIKMDFATNGKECLDKIKSYGKYDVILLDEQLSQISAIELIKKIKSIRNFNIPVILLTKDNSYEYNDDYKKLGFSDYLLKPVKNPDLLNRINKYVKRDN